MKLTLQQAMNEAKRDLTALGSDILLLNKVYRFRGIQSKAVSLSATRKAFDLEWNKYGKRYFRILDKVLERYELVAFNKSRIAVANANMNPAVPASAKQVKDLLIYKVNWLREVQKNILPLLSNHHDSTSVSEDGEDIREIKYPVKEEVSGSRIWGNREPEGVIITRTWFDEENGIGTRLNTYLKFQRELDYEIAALNTSIEVA